MLTPLLLYFNFSLLAQKSDTIKEFHEVNQMAKFPGGEAQLYEFISKNVKYPKEAFKNEIQGKIIVQFIVNKDGTISNVETMGKQIGWGLEEEAMRVIKSMHNWEPAVMRGANVPVTFRLPINFAITDQPKKTKPKSKKKVKSRSKAYD